MDLDRAGQAVVEDLAVDLDRAGQAAVEDPAADLDQEVEVQVAGVEDREEVQEEVAEPEAGWVENWASGAQPQQCCATRWRGEFRERQERDPQG